MRSFSLPSLSILALAVFCISTTTTTTTTTTNAFSFSDIVSKQAKRRQTNGCGVKFNTATTVLGLTTTTRSTTGVVEEDAVYIYNKAREFAFRDDFSINGGGWNNYDKHYHPLEDEMKEIEESKFWLREIMQVQSGCVAGTLAGEDICENQDQAAEIVARLRQKIEIHEKRVAVRTKASESIVPTIATELIVAAILVVVAIFWTTVDIGQRHDDVPSMENYQIWANILKEKDYILSLLGGGTGNSV